MGESEEDDNVSIHEALSSEEEDLALEDAPGQIGGLLLLRKRRLGIVHRRESLRFKGRLLLCK